MYFRERIRWFYEKSRLDLAFWMVLLFGVLYGEVEMEPIAALAVGVGGTIVVAVLYGLMVMRPPRAEDPRDTVSWAVGELESWAWSKGTTLKAVMVRIEDDGSYTMQTWFGEVSEEMAEEFGVEREDEDG